MEVYVDAIFHTFAFSLAPAAAREVAIKGRVTDAKGRPVSSTEVQLMEGNVTHRTFTDGKGNYTFFGHVAGPAQISTAYSHTSVPQATATIREVDLKASN
jgi:protocatechuate 3,4-dioxygenase beta subunit